MKPAPRYAVYLILTTLHFQKGVYAFPDISNLQSYGAGVTANGYARLPAQSLVNYTETYLDDPLSNTIRATYWSSNREIISYKELNFSNNPNIPDYFEVIDYRREKGFRITVNGSVANVKVINTEDEKILLNRDVDIDSSTVIDASFHRFILKYWDRLLNNKPVRVKFLQIDKARLVPLKIKKTNCNTSGAVCFKIVLDNFLLRGLMPSIFMKYDQATQRLIRYTGIGPVTRLNGKAMPVDITYEYLM